MRKVFQDLRRGDAVQLRFRTADSVSEARGTVLRVYGDGDFRVAFESAPDRKPGTPRVRHDFPASARSGFMTKRGPDA